MLRIVVRLGVRMVVRMIVMVVVRIKPIPAHTKIRGWMGGVQVKKVSFDKNENHGLKMDFKTY